MEAQTEFIRRVDWWLFGRSERPARAWGPGTPIFLIVTPLTIWLFSSTGLYTGPIAKLLGGTDIGFFVGFFAASLAYAVVELSAARFESSPAAEV